MIPFSPPSELALGPVHLNSHGLMFLVGAMAAYLWTRARVRRELHPHIDQAATWMTVGGVVGARLLYLVLNPELLLRPLEALAIWQGGLVSYGGLLGALLAWRLYLQAHRLPASVLNEALGPPALLGWGLGRLGCFLNWHNEFGTITDAPWGFVVGSDPPRHPVMLYLALAHILASLFVARVARRRGWRADGLALVAYGANRFVLDQWRFYDPATLLLGSRAFCLALALVGLTVLVRGRRPDPPPGEDPPRDP